MRKTTSGFTIVELIAVIIIISILTALGTFSFLRVQVGTRDSQRSTQINQIAEALEKYYNQRGEYPSCADMAQSINTVVTNTLPGLKPEVLTAPKDTVGNNSILPTCTDMPAGYTSDRFAYVGVSNTNCLTTGCLKWTLKYREEATGNIISLNSRRSELEHVLATTTYTTPGTYTFTIPSNVKSVKLEAHGGQGGHGSNDGVGCSLLNGGLGGLGGKVVNNVNVNAGDQLTVIVGAKGTDAANSCSPTNGGTGGTSSVTKSGQQLLAAYGGGGGTGSYQVCTNMDTDPSSSYYGYCFSYQAYNGNTGSAGSGVSNISGGVVTNGGANYGNNGRVLLTY